MTPSPRVRFQCRVCRLFVVYSVLFLSLSTHLWGSSIINRPSSAFNLDPQHELIDSVINTSKDVESRWIVVGWSGSPRLAYSRTWTYCWNIAGKGLFPLPFCLPGAETTQCDSKQRSPLRDLCCFIGLWKIWSITQPLADLVDQCAYLLNFL